MPVTRCPHCRTELEIDAADFGYRVQCPACQSAFTPEEPEPEPAAPPLPPPPPPPPVVDDGTTVVTCPECNGKVGVLEEDLGHDMRCPLCDKVFTATAGGLPPRASRRDDDDGPSWRQSRSGGGGLPRYDDDRYDRRRSRYDDDEYDRPRRRRSRYDDDSPDELIAHAKRECSASSVGLIIIACWGFFGGLLVIVLYAAMLGGAFPNPNGGPGAGGMSEGEMFFNLGQGLLQLFVSAFPMYAGLQMRQAKQYGMCMIACVIAMVPVFSPCCLLGLIFGIMGIVKLNETRVKRGFDANKPDYQSDGYN